MIQDDFRKFVMDISHFYGLNKVVDAERFSMWFEQVKKIPTEAIPAIYTKLISEKDTMPRNVPKCVKEYFRQWISENPDKSAYQNFQRTKCDDCGGKGIIWYRKTFGDDRNIKAVRCASCRNWTRHVGDQCGLTFRKRSEIERNGCEIV